MKNILHEKRTHGTSVFPLQVYSHHDKDGFYSVSEHWHEEVEWIYVEYGSIMVSTLGNSYTLNANEFCFINSGELHAVQATEKSLHHAIVFNLNFLDFELYDACQHNFIRPVTGNKFLFPTICTTLNPQQMHLLLSHMQEIVQLYHTLPACALLSIKIHLLQILELLFQTNSFIENTLTSKEKDSLSKLKKVIEYIHHNYSNPISLQTLAEISFMSPNYFCSYFRQEIGKSPISFINEYRIQKAAKLLSETDLSVSQIALSVGFDNPSYFIRKFQEYKKITPKKYRFNVRHS